MKAFKEKLNDKFDTNPIISIRKLAKIAAHWHVQCEILYVLEGHLTAGINNHQAKVEKGGITIACSNDLHYYLDSSCKFLFLFFHPEMLGLNTWLTDSKIINPIIDGIDVPSAIKDKCNAIADKCNNGVNNLILKGDCLILCGLIEDLLPTTPLSQTNNSEYILKAIDFIQNNFRNDIDLITTANICNISKDHLSRTFSQYTGMNFTRYVNTLRISHSEELLSNTDIKISDIAYESGFESLRTFNRLFKQIKGLTPNEFRNFQNPNVKDIINSSII